MSNANQVLYFVSQSYRQIQISVDKGLEPYTYGDFARQFNNLLVSSDNETYARELTLFLVDETIRYRKTVDYLRQEMAFEAQASAERDRAKVALAELKKSENSGSDDQLDLYNRRLSRKVA
ncbi:hypothetical protein IC229_16135 [Spirosoma sp. BT702]|uniref:Uncharacterized protein n=2 Tax=Spirosoma profusum TaxID=2771354 RepID=A0A926Y1E6_9BACT|nr:hypothetical protein [Spirosoma profusum]